MYKLIKGKLLALIILAIVCMGVAFCLLNRNNDESISDSPPALTDSDFCAPTGSINGHSYVDLGLSVMWATCNVGAFSPEGYGGYFAWGETSVRSRYWEDNSKTFCNSSYDQDIGGYISTDAARANWGGSWRLPTAEEFEELLDSCEWTCTTLNGKKGYKVVSKKNGNSIFLPAAGFRVQTFLSDAGKSGSYWSSTPHEDTSMFAYALDFSSGYHNVFRSYRYYGLTVRPVCPVCDARTDTENEEK